MKNETVALVVSYNRPLQCDLALKSLKLHCEDYDLLDVVVLYKVDNEETNDLYQTCSKENPSVKFTREYMFQTNLQMALMDYKYVFFIVDDTIFTSNFNVARIEEMIDHRSDVLGFSLRLGKNTTYCYSLDKEQELPKFLTDGDHLFWDWFAGNSDWGYPIEISSSLYKTEIIQNLMDKFEYYPNPNVFEFLLDRMKWTIESKYPKMACYEHSVAFANPLNKVRQDNQNRASRNIRYSANNLLYAYEEWLRIDPLQFAGFVPDACHYVMGFKEVEL